MPDARTLHLLRGLAAILALLGALTLLDEAGAKLSGPRLPIPAVVPVAVAL
jgi:hypothetical protein